MICDDQKTSQGVIVSPQIFRAAVEDDVGAQRQWPLELGRQKGVVDNQQQSVLFCKMRNGGDIGDLHSRIGGRLDKQRPRGWTYF